jgi:lincosamide nucleotidyltransferase A/C/D/E
MMTGESVIEFVGLFTDVGVDVWLDGGWGVDALVGYQTRAHDALDVVVRLDQVKLIQDALASRGFSVWEDELPTRFVMRDSQDRRIDFHPVEFDAGGGGLQTLQNGHRFRYPPEGFRGAGTVQGQRVPCLTAEVQVLCHTGYEPDATDLHDVYLLHERFGIPLPNGYEQSSNS